MLDNSGFITDFKLLGNDYSVDEYDDFYCVKTRSNPTFIDGNYILLKTPPTSKSSKELEDLYHFHFGESSDFCAFKWNGNQPFANDNLLNNGFKWDYDIVLEIKEDQITIPDKRNENISVRPFQSDNDWDNWLQIAIESRNPGFSKTSFSPYIQKRRNFYRILAAQNKGNFYGAFINQEQVGSAGLFQFDQLGRFQEVKTSASFRRQGVCHTLIYEMIVRNIDSLNKIIIAADPNYHALKIYENVGFKRKHFHSRLGKRQPE